MATCCIPRSETLLIRQAGAGNRAAFAKLSSECYAKLYRVSLRILKNSADAEDNVQDALCKAFTKMKQFKGEARFSTWMVRIATNEALMTLRKHRSRHNQTVTANGGQTEASELPLETIDRRPNPERQYLARELTAKALNELPNSVKDAFLLQQIEGWTNRELAARQRISAQTMKSRMFRAKSMLAKRMPALLAARAHDIRSATS